MAALFRPIIIIPVALILFVVAGVMLWSGLRQQGTAPNAAQQQATTAAVGTVVVASTDILAGQVLASGDISLHNENPAHIPATALHQAGNAQGHMALVDIHAGAPVLRSLVSKNIVNGIASHVPVGYRAYALSVNESAIVGGFLQVGDHVDLYVTLPGALFGKQTGTGRKLDDQSKSTLLLPDVNVLAVGTKLKTDGTADTSAHTVTVALKSDALAKIALAARLGAVTFAIRNPIDQSAVPPQTATLSTLVNATAAPVPAPTRHAAPVNSVIVYTGRDRSTVHVP